MNTRSKLPAFCLWLLSAFLCVCLPVRAQNQDPFSIRVESNLVLVHTQVYNWHSANTPAYRQCRSANSSTFDNLPNLLKKC
jgi:hypothetical protein